MIPNPYITNVGAYDSSTSAYGTFDQGGNMYEWNEADIFGDGSVRGLRGGSFSLSESTLAASYREYGSPVSEGSGFGFRVASVVSPAGASPKSVSVRKTTRDNRKPARPAGKTSGDYNWKSYRGHQYALTKKHGPW